jgi:hypothetical protein
MAGVCPNRGRSESYFSRRKENFFAARRYLLKADFTAPSMSRLFLLILSVGFIVLVSALAVFAFGL